jgi:hypothetical protein
LTPSRFYFAADLSNQGSAINSNCAFIAVDPERLSMEVERVMIDVGADQDGCIPSKRKVSLLSGYKNAKKSKKSNIDMNNWTFIVKQRVHAGIGRDNEADEGLDAGSDETEDEDQDQEELEDAEEDEDQGEL